MLRNARASRSAGLRCARSSRSRAAAAPKWFVTVGHALSVAGELRLDEHQTIVYRALAPEAAPPVTAALPGPEFGHIWRLDSTALFRYSALTCNGHRIHYDADYWRAMEGYPGLVVHDPLIATLLLDLYAAQGRPPAVFRYRARRPLFLPQPLVTGGRADGAAARLWASDGAGQIVMEGQAEGSEGAGG